ncbi:hypothetical protein [Nannocystis pusilla]
MSSPPGEPATVPPAGRSPRCLDQGADLMAIAAGECCGWEPFELGD